VADSEEWSAERRSRLVMRVLSGELTLEEAAEQNALDPATLEQWRETFIAGGRGAVAREQPRAPAASRARFPVGKALIGAGALLLLLLLVAAGVWFVRRPRPSEAQKRCDQAAVAALLKLKRPMTITAYTSAGLPDLDEAGASLDRLLHAWASQSQGRLVYRRVIVKTPEQRAEAKDRGLQEAAFGSPSAAGAMLSTGYLGLAFSYGNENGVIPQLSPNGLDGVEFWIANKIRELRAKADEEHIGVAVLDGAGEIGLDARDLIARNAGVSTGPSIKSILNQSFPFYTIDKAPASASLDGLRNAEVLFVTQPDRDLTDD
jgi:transposase-like protein